MMPRIGWALLAVAFISGAIGDRVPARAPIIAGGYQVLAADFHNHSSTWSDGAQTPVGLLWTAERQGLDVVAITGHNQVSDAKVGRWLSRVFGGPTVIVGQELLAADHHIIALGTEQKIVLSKPAEQIAEVHRQGGVAIVAHPLKQFWAAFDDESKRMLDGSEICHPMVYRDQLSNGEQPAASFEQFRAGYDLAAIGSSDFHGNGRIGQCRTYVFATDNSAAAVIDAIRARRTVVYTPAKTFGDPALAALIADRPELRTAATADAPVTMLDWISRATSILGLLILVWNRRWPFPQTR